MKYAMTFASLLAILCSSCIKDDLAPANLTTNPIDLDYNGTPLLVLASDTVRFTTDFNGNPEDTILEQRIHVRSELLSPLTAWAWSVKNLTTGQVTTSTESGFNDAYTPIHHVVNGSTHCFEYTLYVYYFPTKPYTFCSTATW